MTRLSPQLRWLSVGIGLKRWLVMLVAGSAVLGMGFVYGLIWLRRNGLLSSSRLYEALTLQWLPPWLAMLAPLILGTALIIAALLKLGVNLTAPFRRPDESIAEQIYAYQRRNRGPKIVAIGGGTGLSTLLRGLTGFTRNVTAIVTVADDGGSSGRLRREFGILPPGDFRNNLAALSRDEALMTQLLQYRFGGNVAGGEKSELSGHAFGNLLITALVGLTGSFEEALLAAQRVLAIRGRVLPSTLVPVILEADVMIDGRLTRVEGESNIPLAAGKIERVYLNPADVRAYPEAVQAVLQADLVVLGPGSLYTSILPNLLVGDLAEALRHSRAKKVYVCNLATQLGETDRYSVADHVEMLLKHITPDCLDFVLANNNFSVPADTGGGQTIYVPLDEPPDGRLVVADLVDEARPWRHDSSKLAAKVVSMIS